MLQQQTKHALGASAVLTIISRSSADGRRLLAELWTEIENFEARFSRFRVESEVSQLNSAAGQTLSVSAEFRELLTTAIALSKETGGLYNPLILPALQQAGYIGSWPRTDSFDRRLDYSNRRLHPVTDLRIHDEAVRLPADAALDFGGIGKGYLLDKLADQAERQGCGSYWFSLGGDIICRGHDETGQPWQLGIATAEQPELAVAHVRNQHGRRLALATSGVTKRSGSAAGRNWHHLIDPRSGLPAETDILTASVVAPRAVTADVFASCLLLLGSQAAVKFLEERQLAGLLQTTYSTPHSRNLRLIGKAIELPSATTQ